VNENRNIASGGECHLNQMVFAFGLVEGRETLSKTVRLDASDRVLSGIKYGFGTTEDLSRDVVFGKLADRARNELVAHISEQVGKSWPLGQCFYNALQFGPLRFRELGAGILRH
jgi:hypothetical protein